MVPAAEAKLPTPKVTTIVPGKSVAGVTLGIKLSAFRTAKGIGVGSTLAALRAAYPALGTSLGPDNPSLGSGSTITSFYTKGGRVKSIPVGSPY